MTMLCIRDELSGQYWSGTVFGPHDAAKVFASAEAARAELEYLTRSGPNCYRIAPLGPTPEQVNAWGEKLAAHLSSIDRVQFELSTTHAIAVLSFLQLALRHEFVGDARCHPSAVLVREVRDLLIGLLAGGDGGIELLLRMGDDPRFDV